MDNDISHQNKDICFKILTENYKNKSLKAYGLDLPKIKQLLPTNLPSIQLDEKRADNVFLLEDGSILLLEYESSNSFKTLFKNGHYAFRIAEKYIDAFGRKIIIVIIYTSDVKSAPSTLDIGGIKLNFQQVFLSKFDENQIYNDLKDKISNNKPLSDEDVMRFIILPLTKKKDKQELIEKSIDLAKQIKDENTQEFIIAGIVCVTDKFIDKKYSNKIKEWISMTKLARLYEEEKNEAVKKTWDEAWEKSWAEAWEKSREQTLKETREEIWKETWAEAWEKSREKAQNDLSKVIAKNMLNANKDVAEIVQMTGLSESEVLLLKNINIGETKHNG